LDRRKSSKLFLLDHIFDFNLKHVQKWIPNLPPLPTAREARKLKQSPSNHPQENLRPHQALFSSIFIDVTHDQLQLAPGDSVHCGSVVCGSERLYANRATQPHGCLLPISFFDGMYEKRASPLKRLLAVVKQLDELCVGETSECNL
jgi:hypothetical protein